MSDILTRIAADKRLEIDERKISMPLPILKQRIKDQTGERHSFSKALSDKSKVNIIAELKKGSPSRGVIVSDFDPGMTAAELIQSRANHLLPNMGLTSWKDGEVRKTDVTTAKNYLKEEEIDELNRIVVMWLDFAEDQAKHRKQVFMKDWEQKLDEFLHFNERKVLPNAGKVSKQSAEEHAKTEYEQFEIRRRAYKESVGEAESIKQLEEASKDLKQLEKSKGPSDN